MNRCIYCDDNISIWADNLSTDKTVADCYHVINKQILDFYEEIELIFNNNSKKLNLKEKRNKWYNEESDFIVIEIKPKDNINNLENQDVNHEEEEENEEHEESQNSENNSDDSGSDD